MSAVISRLDSVLEPMKNEVYNLYNKHKDHLDDSSSTIKRQDEYGLREIQPPLPNAWKIWSKDRIGYEIYFKNYFYKFMHLRTVEEIKKELDQSILKSKMFKKICN